METKRDLLNYGLQVRGIFGRNRKSKFEIFPLLKGVDPKTPKTLDEIMPLARAKLAEIKFKSGEWIIREDPVTETTYPPSAPGGEPIVLEGFVLMSERRMHVERV